MLTQKSDEEVPIILIHRKLNAAELNYTITENECLAIVWCIEKPRMYLMPEFILALIIVH